MINYTTMKSLVIFFFFAGLCWADEEISSNEVRNSSKSLKGNKTAIEIYRNLFKMKRKYHIQAIEQLNLMDNVEERHKMIVIMLGGIVLTIRSGQKVLLRANYQPGDPFPKEIEIKDGLSKVIENTALLTDLVVRFPFICEREIKENYDDWMGTFKYARKISKKSNVFVGKHAKILHSLGQELKLDEPDPEYKNPFRERTEVVPKSSEERQKEYEEKKRKERYATKKKKKNKPKLSKTEL